MSNKKSNNKKRINTAAPATPVKQVKSKSLSTRDFIALGLGAVALFALFQFARTTANMAAATPTTTSSATGTASSATGAAVTNDSGATSTAVGDGKIQKISVAVNGSYNPSTIKLKANQPAEITFSQSSGCTSYVQSQDLGFSEDLTAGPKTVKLAGLKPGTYGFACGMGMVNGQVVVE